MQRTGYVQYAKDGEKSMKPKFASKFEKWAFDILDKQKIKVRYEPDTFKYHKRTFKTYCGDCGSKNTYKVARYTPDFRIGKNIYIETKGYLKSTIRTAMEDFVKHHPNIDLRFVFAADNFLTKSKAGRYSDWIKELGLPYAIKEIPEEWIEEAREQIASRR